MKILIIRLSSIGDIVLTTPVLRCIKKARPDIHIHYMCKPAFVSILQPNPYIDRLHEYGQNMSDLKNEHFDYIIDLQNNHRSRMVCRQLHCPAKHLHKLNFKKWLLVHFKINILPHKHIVDRYMDTARILPFDIENDRLGLDFFLTEEDETIADSLPSQPYLAIAVGSQHYTKELPSQKIINICNQTTLPIVLLGGKTDMEKSQAIVNQCNRPVTNLCGQLSIRQSAAAVKHAKYLLTGDTGLMHIGAALHTTVISVWGNTTPSLGMYPYMPDTPEKYHIIENKHLTCRPCSKLGYKACPHKHFKCMTTINEQDILHILHG